MTTDAGSDLISAVRRLISAEDAEDAAWSAVLGIRATYEGARAAQNRKASAQAYVDLVFALNALADPVGEIVEARAAVDVLAPWLAVEVTIPEVK